VASKAQGGLTKGKVQPVRGAMGIVKVDVTEKESLPCKNGGGGEEDWFNGKAWFPGFKGGKIWTDNRNLLFRTSRKDDEGGKKKKGAGTMVDKR